MFILQDKAHPKSFLSKIFHSEKTENWPNTPKQIQTTQPCECVIFDKQIIKDGSCNT